MYPNPFNGVPAGALLRGRDAAFGIIFGVDGIPGVLAGDGVNGVENGCAAEVEVAAGGLSGRSRREVEEKGRKIEDRGNDGDSRRVQR